MQYVTSHGQAGQQHQLTCINDANCYYMEFMEVNAGAYTVAVLILVLPPTLVTTATATMQAIGREYQW